MASPKNNDAIVTLLTKRIGAVEKHLKAEKAEIPVQGSLLKANALMKLYQTSLDARAAVTAGYAAYQGALKARDEAEIDRLAADESLKGWVLGRYGAGSAEANEFGFAPRKTPVVSAATRAAAVVHGQATREARGTKGKKQRLKIKGVVPTSTAPAAPAVTPTTSVPAQTLVALPALLTTAPPTATSSAPSAQVAAGAAAAPPPTVTPVPPAVTVTPAPAVVTAPVVAGPAQGTTHA